ncbi:hybrid sensor histidine kinase/response regulator [Neoaquamicrobium microcysteis]|nr:ATP-binding protein [Mesorhizobium microcysteis]
MERFLQAMAIAAVVLALTGLVAWHLIRQLVSPLGQLATTLSAIGAGSELSLRLNTTRNDEVGILIGAFNIMLGKLGERDRKLRELNDSLEETVKLRTAQLQNAKEEAERANQAKSDFLATMSHEIRTPMNSMMVMAEMLAGAQLTPKQLRFAEIIKRSGHGLLNIINDILDLSKIEAGSLQLESIPFCLETIVEDVASLFAEKARGKGLSIATHVPHDLPTELAGDPTRIGQIVTNLVNNALKFTESGGVDIEVSARQAARGRLAVEIAVRDSGIGMAPEALARVFERFTQADQSTTRKYGGTGLGLSITKRLVEAMDGTITVESVEGHGSIFRVALELQILASAPPTVDISKTRIMLAIADGRTLRAARGAFAARGADIVTEARAQDIDLVVADLAGFASLQPALDQYAPRILLRSIGSLAGLEAAPEWRNAPQIDLPLRSRDVDRIASCLAMSDFSSLRDDVDADNRTATLPSFTGLKILAVDDNAVNREVLIEALASLGVTPTIADSGVAAIERAEQDAFDVIFMDCSMPGMDGFEATRCIRDLEREKMRTPAQIVALTAHVTGPESQRWRSASMDGYVAKPFTLAQLARALAQTKDAIDQPATAPASLGGAQAMAWRDVPLLSRDTLAMFATLGQGGQSIASRVFGLFASNAPQAVAELRAAIDTKRADETAKLAHALKSMCSSAGAARCRAICQMLEDEVGADHIRGQALCGELERALADTMSAMDGSSLTDERRYAAGSA